MSLDELESFLRTRLTEPLPGAEAQWRFSPRPTRKGWRPELQPETARRAAALILLYPHDNDPVFALTPDGTRYVPVPSAVPTRIPEPGLPFSLVFRAEPGREDVILRIASAYEAASRRRIPPPAFGPLPA